MTKKRRIKNKGPDAQLNNVRDADHSNIRENTGYFSEEGWKLHK